MTQASSWRDAACWEDVGASSFSKREGEKDAAKDERHIKNKHKTGGGMTGLFLLHFTGFGPTWEEWKKSGDLVRNRV